MEQQQDSALVKKVLRSFHERKNDEVSTKIEFELGAMPPESIQKLADVGRALNELGIRFDVSYDENNHTLVWYLDSSLRGPLTVRFKNFITEETPNRYAEEVLDG